MLSAEKMQKHLDDNHCKIMEKTYKSIERRIEFQTSIGSSTAKLFYNSGTDNELDSSHIKRLRDEGFVVYVPWLVGPLEDYVPGLSGLVSWEKNPNHMWNTIQVNFAEVLFILYGGSLLTLLSLSILLSILGI